MPLIDCVLLIIVVSSLIWVVILAAFSRLPKHLAVIAAATVLLAIVTLVDRAYAKTVAEIPGVAVFTDEHGECPRLYRIAKDPDGKLGCWTIGEHDRSVRIEWADGRVEEYSEVRFNIYAR